ncbi:MAG: efflux RND transporter permease subunit [Rikenellaceae bacterium]
MVEKFINRPVLSTVFSIIISLLGVIGLMSLPITLFPDIAPPMVSVTTNYQGANASVVLKSVNAPLEEQINGVENMTYISSKAANDGSSDISVYFTLGTDADLASVNVQTRVSAATSKLPQAVTEYGVTTQKKQNSMLIMAAFYSENPEYDATFVENYLRINIYPEMQRVPGVGQVSIFGARDYSMRVWLKPDRLAAYNLVPSDIVAAIQEQNIEAAPGKFGENSNQSLTYTIRYKGKFTDPADYESIVIKAMSDGRILYLKDVARIELGAFNYTVLTNSNGYPGAAFAVYQMAGTNAKQIVSDIKEVLASAAETMPEGFKYVLPYDTNKFLDASIEQVVHTFFEAFVLVVLVVFVFLQDMRSTLIPTIAALVSIVGTFFFLLMFGFTLNILTLFALVLAIGMVVDDAIVVVEAVHEKMHGEGMRNTKKATISAMSEITGAIISITFVMAAVFLPITFMSGPTGVFYNQFAITLAVAILISALNALTLSPVLCTLLLKPPKEGGKKPLSQRMLGGFNVALDYVTKKYVLSLGKLIKHKIFPVLGLIFFGFMFYWFIMNTPSAFIPTEDQGVIFVDVSLPAGSSVERTEAVLSEITTIADSIDEVVDNLAIAGTSLVTGTSSSSYGLIVFSLKDWEERPESDVTAVMAELKAKTSHIKTAKIQYFVPPTVSGFSATDGFEMQLQDRNDSETAKFYAVAMDFIKALNQQPEIAFAYSSFNVNFPQYEFDVNVDKCKLMGVTVSDVFSALQIYYGSTQASDFNRFSKYYRVMVQSEADQRANIETLSTIMVRNSRGEMVPISTFVEFKRVYGSESLTRFNLYNSATINGSPATGYSSGDAIAAMQRVAAESLPQGYGYEFSGMTREETGSGTQTAFIFLLSFIFVYLILAAQYESYIVPWAVMLSLACGMCGVYIFVWLAGLDNNIYVQVALIMLIGLLAKNGILIVEFAMQRRAHGLSLTEAAKEAASARLRPILMTSLTFIFGMIPLVLASGAAAKGNVSIGVAAIGGMSVGTLFGVFIIPVLFVIFKSLDEKMKRPEPNENEEEEQ